MTLHQLRIFEAVARYRNITNAAKELNISQPSVSQQIKLLEEEFGDTFFERSNHGVELNTLGRSFLDAVRPTLTQINNLETDFSVRGRATKTDTLLVGGTTTLCDILPPVLVDFQKRNPSVAIVMHSADSRVIEGYVLDAKVEIALITRPSYLPNCTYETFQEYHVVAFLPNKGSINSPTISLKELARYPLVAKRGSSCIKEIIRQGLTLNFSLECDAPETVKFAVRSGLGMGVLFSALLEQHRDRKEFHLMKVPELNNITRRSYIVYDKRRPLSASAQDFLATLQRIRKRSEKNHLNIN